MKLRFYRLALGLLKSARLRFVVVLGGEPMMPEVCGDLFPVALVAEDKEGNNDARACLICLWNGLRLNKEVPVTTV